MLILRRQLRTLASRLLTDSKGQPLTLDISTSAVKKLQHLYAQDNTKMLRVAVDSGGCHGLTYSFQLSAASEPTEAASNEDIIFREEGSGVRVVVDALSLPYIAGSEIGYEETFMRSAFTITGNPQAGSECGCGTSFDVKR